jgi:hypothetical protein
LTLLTFLQKKFIFPPGEEIHGSVRSMLAFWIGGAHGKGPPGGVPKLIDRGYARGMARGMAQGMY